MANKTDELPPLEQHLLLSMRAIDNQIAREMQRDSKRREAQGVQKWEPYQKRIENLVGFLLENLGTQEIELDSLIVLTQASAKALRMLVEDLGEEGLGKVRAAYCLGTAEQVEKDADGVQKLLQPEPMLS